MSTHQNTEPTLTNVFVGRLTAAPTLTQHGDLSVTHFKLIRSEYAGKDEQTGDIRIRKVALPFTAFRHQAAAIAQHVCKGDQLIVWFRIENNLYQDKDGNDQYGYNFIVDSFQFGAPGETKRRQLADESQAA